MKYQEISFEEACQLYELHVPMEYSHRWADWKDYHSWQPYPTDSQIEGNYDWTNPPPKWAKDSLQPDGKLDVRFRVPVE